MTDVIDSGDIPRIDDLGTEPTTDLRHYATRRDTTDEHTQNIGPYAEFSHPIRRPAAGQIVDIDETVIYLPQSIGVVDTSAFERVADPAETAVHTILDSLAGARAGLDGCVDLEGPQKPPPPLPKPKLRRSVPVAAMVDRQPPGVFKRVRHKGKRRKPETRRVSPWWGVAIAVGFGLAVYAGLLVAVLAVVR